MRRAALFALCWRAGDCQGCAAPRRGLALTVARSPAIPAAAGVPLVLLGRGPHDFFSPGPVALPLLHLSGSEQRPPCPHFNESGGEGGTHRFSVFARLAGLGPGRAFPRGCRFPLGPMRRERGPMRSRICGEALAHRPEAQAPACPGRRRVEPPARAAKHRLNLGPRGDARPQAGF